MMIHLMIQLGEMKQVIGKIKIRFCYITMKMYILNNQICLNKLQKMRIFFVYCYLFPPNCIFLKTLPAAANPETGIPVYIFYKPFSCYNFSKSVLLHTHIFQTIKNQIYVYIFQFNF